MKENAPRGQPVLAVVVERDNLHENVPELGALLEMTEHGPAEHVRQEHVERDRGRVKFPRQIQRFGAARGGRVIDDVEHAAALQSVTSGIHVDVVRVRGKLREKRGQRFARRIDDDVQIVG